MRSVIAAAPFVAAVAFAQGTTTHYGTTLVPEISNGKTVTSTYTYSNPATLYLTETDSNGVVTGLPSNTAATAGTELVTAQPPVATIPAGISGTTVIYYNASTGLTSFTVDGSESTTSVLGGVQVPTTMASSAFPSSQGGSGSQTTGRGGNGNGNGNGGSQTQSAAASSSTGAAASNMHLASGSLVGLAAFFAALL